MRTSSRGGSLVELMVGLAVGLFVAAVAVAALHQQLQDGRRLLLELRLEQDLRTTTQLVAQHVRRAGHWAAAEQGLWRPDGRAAPAANPHVLQAASGALVVAYSEPSPDHAAPAPAGRQLALRLHGAVLQMALAGGAWQALTDPGWMRVESFTVSPRAVDDPVGASCHAAARLQHVDIAVRATAARDPSLAREVAARVRVRNDAMVGGCAA